MEKQREINAMGVIYAILLLANIVISTLGLILIHMGIAVPSTLATFLCEIAVLLPVILYLRSKGENIPERLGFHKIKISTVLLTVLLTLVSVPVSIFANAFSQLFVKNTVVQGAGELTGASVILTLVATSVMAPLCEEIAFRGFLFDGLKGTFQVLKAAAVSAMLFGIMHLNFNQFCYAFVLGMIFALANHASGSTWTSVIMHFLFNFINVMIMLLTQLSLEKQGMNYAQVQEEIRLQPGAMLNTVLVYGVLSVICAFLIWALLKTIAKREGNLEAFKSSFAGKGHSDAASDTGVRFHSLLNVPMMFSIIIGVAAMIVYQVTVL